MSMFFLRNFLTIFCLTIFLNFLIPFSQAWSWSGFDYENEANIEIGSGNLVREGERITIYDSAIGEDIKVEVLEMANSFHGTRLEVVEVETNKKRILEME